MSFAGFYASIDEVGFLMWRHAFNMAAMTSAAASTCCICSSVRRLPAERVWCHWQLGSLYATSLQFLIHSTLNYIRTCFVNAWASLCLFVSVSLGLHDFFWLHCALWPSYTCSCFLSSDTSKSADIHRKKRPLKVSGKAVGIIRGSRKFSGHSYSL